MAWHVMQFFAFAKSAFANALFETTPAIKATAKHIEVLIFSPKN
jgi:hypothetical protein